MARMEAASIPGSNRKRCVWERLVDEGWASSRAEAEKRVMLRKVYADGIPVTSAGHHLPIHSKLEVRGLDARYVAKGGYKLESALDAFGLDISGRIAIDAGASTGGFTDCLIKRGCALVYAVDAGFGQLHGTLRANNAVVNMERTNISDPALSALDPPPTFGTADLSYLSLRKAVPAFSRALRGSGDLLCLVKPLFEIADARARRVGVIPDSAYAPTLHALCEALTAPPPGPAAKIREITHSPVTGNAGTVEFFLWLTLGSAAESLPADVLDNRIEKAVAAGLALQPFNRKKRNYTVRSGPT